MFLLWIGLKVNVLERVLLSHQPLLKFLACERILFYAALHLLSAVYLVFHLLQLKAFQDVSDAVLVAQISLFSRPQLCILQFQYAVSVVFWDTEGYHV